METNVYTRHSSSCPHKDKPAHRGCRCPKWIYIARIDKRISAKTRSWAKAMEKAREMAEEKPEVLASVTVVTVADAMADEKLTIDQVIDEYLEDKGLQGLDESTLYKLSIIFRKQLGQFCRNHGVVYPDELTLAKLRQFRASWKDQALARKKKQERLIGFFKFCVAQGWMQNNPAKGLSAVLVKDAAPTSYFDRNEMQKLLHAIGGMYIDKRGLGDSTPEQLRKRVMALVLLLRWSGLRIGDAVSLERARLTDDGRLFLYTAKTGTPVFMPLPPHVAKLLHELPNSNPKYFFWTGNGLTKTAVADWQRVLRRMFKLANLGKRCHPHMFRDTFAVELLLAGVPIDQVSVLLGHASVRITEKHYSPWVRTRQAQLELSVQKAWTGAAGGTLDSAVTAPALSQ